MHFTLLVAGALLPGELAAALSPSLNVPNLQARLARASVIEQSASTSKGAAHLDWLAKKLFAQSTPAATAPYAYAHLAGRPSDASVWHADPVHIEVARDHLIVQELGSAAPTPIESQQLISVANKLLRGSGCELVAMEECWFLLCAHDWQIETPALQAVIGVAVELPTGRDAQLWNRLHNEIQIAWHADTVNGEREARGALTINALWLHGGGRWRSLPTTEFACVQADWAAWQGAAHAAGAQSSSQTAPVANGALLIAQAPLAAKRCQEWAAWLQAMTATDSLVNGHDADSITVVLCGETTRTFESRPLDRFKPWRRRTLAQALTE